MKDVLARIAAAEARLAATVAAMTDEEAAAPSRLPGWTRAMCVTHTARNADSNAAMIEAALRGEEREQYPGGAAAREAGIEAGRGRSAAEVAADLAEAAGYFARVAAAVPDDGWELVVPALAGPATVRDRTYGREFEVELHHADLGLAYGWSDWSPEFAAVHLPRIVGGLARRRTDAAVPGRWRVGAHDVVVEPGGAEGAVEGIDAALLAWLTGRATFDEAGLVATGDRRVRDLPDWFSFG